MYRITHPRDCTRGLYFFRSDSSSRIHDHSHDRRFVIAHSAEALIATSWTISSQRCTRYLTLYGENSAASAACIFRQGMKCPSGIIASAYRVYERDNYCTRFSLVTLLSLRGAFCSSNTSDMTSFVETSMFLCTFYRFTDALKKMEIPSRAD